MSEPIVVILPAADDASLSAAERIAEILDRTIGDRGAAHWATTGGSTPGAIYAHLARPPLRDDVDWRQVHLWWADDRFVPYDHPLSNVKIAFDSLLEAGAYSGQSGTGSSGIDVITGRRPGVPMPADNVHPFEIGVAIGEGHDPDWCADLYADEIRAEGIDVGASGLPAFDLLLLGIGPDGHIMSVFPGSAAFDSDRWAMGVPAPTHVEPHVPRVTLHPGVVEAAHNVVVACHGIAKANILGDVLGGPVDTRRLPAQLARRAGATWILDQAAASRLPRPAER